MADQITKSVRRIVKGMKDDPLGLDAPDDYKSLGTSRGEAFINARGDVTGSGSNGSGDDKDERPTSGTPDSGDPDDNDTGGGGGVNDGSDPANSLSGDVADVDAAINSSSQIGTLTGTVSGTLTSLNLNTLEGIEYIPPIGWTSPESEGFVSTWSGDALNPSNGCQIGCPASSSAAEVRTWDPNTGFTWVVTQWIDAFTPNTLVGFDVASNCFACATYETHFPQLLVSTTTTSTPPPTTDIDWPSNGVCDVVYDSAAEGYKGHVKDTDCSTTQILPTDFVIIRSASDPSKYFRYTKLANGGTKITQVDAIGTPVPGSVTKTTDEGGRVDGFYDVSLDAGIK